MEEKRGLLYAGLEIRGQQIFDIFWETGTRLVYVWHRDNYIEGNIVLTNTHVTANSIPDALQQAKKLRTEEF